MAITRSSASSIAVAVLLITCLPKLAAAGAGKQDPRDDVELVKENVEPTQEEIARVGARNSYEASRVARQAADVANKVAVHSVHITQHAQSALKSAQEALHHARVDTSSMSKSQLESLRRAESKLRSATATADYGKLKAQSQRDDMQVLKKKLDRTASQSRSDLSQMKEELQQLRDRIARNQSPDDPTIQDLQKELDELQELLEQMDAEEARQKKYGTHDELKVELERVREALDRLEKKQYARVDVSMPRAEVDDGTQKVEVVVPANPDKYVPARRPAQIVPASQPLEKDVPIPAGGIDGGIDIDTEMPYGELEPFGREDTAQELTESSINQSNGMVDQLERAEVAEEKRAVFRALTRLRGAAITSFDGVARSQTGNIDEYNKVHKWRNTHPLHHLADEESDISKWAFPDNADF